MTDAPSIIQNSNGIWMLEGEQLWDSDILPVCLEHIKEGDTVIDAGAWIGGHTMAYAQKVGESGWVWSFEPNPYAYECLKLNTQEFQNVDINKVALGEDFSRSEFSAKKGWFDSGYVGDDQKIAAVRIDPLDDYHIAPNFIKIDVEGCELKVLKGAANTVEKHRPIIVLEINRPALERQGNTREQVFDWLHGRNYTYQPIDNYMSDIYNILSLP